MKVITFCVLVLAAVWTWDALAHSTADATINLLTVFAIVMVYEAGSWFYRTRIRIKGRR